MPTEEELLGVDGIPGMSPLHVLIHLHEVNMR